MITEPWSRQLNLDTPAGRLLKRLVSVLPKNRTFIITLFGSAPLQINIEPGLLSGDVDLFSNEEQLTEWVIEAGLGDQQHRPFIQFCS